MKGKPRINIFLLVSHFTGHDKTSREKSEGPLSRKRIGHPTRLPLICVIIYVIGNFNRDRKEISSRLFESFNSRGFKRETFEKFVPVSGNNKVR